MEKIYKWLSTLPGATDPDDLRQETFPILLPTMYALAGISLFRSLRLTGIELTSSLLVVFVLGVGALGAKEIYRHNFRIAWHWLAFSLVIAISLDTWGFSDSPSRYFYSIPIFMTSLLAFRWSLILVTAFSGLSYTLVILSQDYSWSDPDRVVGPLILILFVAAVTWVTSQPLNMELRRSRDAGARIRDMLEQLRTQRAELTRTIKALEFANDRIERMNVELIDARNAAEDADRVKTEFLAHMSHELRTPLNAILNFTAFVTDGLMGEVNDEQVDTLQKVIDSGNHLLSLINDVLDISKIEAGMMNLFIEDVDLNAVLRGTVSTTKGLIKNKPVELVTELKDDLPVIKGDRRRIRQIFLNLVSNAVKFTPQGTITIEAHQQNGQIYVAVRDTGVGIAVEDQADVFVAFKQAKHDLQVSGTGLGLPICKHFVEAHGGKLWLESEHGKGTTFFVTLPLTEVTEITAV